MIDRASRWKAISVCPALAGWPVAGSYAGQLISRVTLSGTNMEVEHGPMEDNFPLQTAGMPLPC